MKSKVKKPIRPKGKKLTLTLSEREMLALTRFAEAHGATRAVAARRMLRNQLADFVKGLPAAEAKNQLDLFDSVQIDIFNQTSKVDDRTSAEEPRKVGKK